MRFVDPPTLDSPWQERPGDELDGLLTAYFQRELPSPWPTAPQVEEAPVILHRLPTPRKTLWSSRVALAASIVALLAAGWMLSGTFVDLPKDGPEATSGPGTATKPKTFKGRVKTSLQEQPSGEIGIRIDVLPEEGMDDEIDQNLGSDFPKPRK